MLCRGTSGIKCPRSPTVDFEIGPFSLLRYAYMKPRLSATQPNSYSYYHDYSFVHTNICFHCRSHCWGSCLAVENEQKKTDGLFLLWSVSHPGFPRERPVSALLGPSEPHTSSESSPCPGTSSPGFSSSALGRHATGPGQGPGTWDLGHWTLLPDAVCGLVLVGPWPPPSPCPKFTSTPTYHLAGDLPLRSISLAAHLG